jgi:succinyl-diaminopimelate desuccinylase
LAALTEVKWDNGNEYFPPTSLQISNINSGTGATNVIPGQLAVMFNFRFCTEQTAAGLRSAVVEHLERAGLTFDLDWELSGNPFITEPGDLTVAVIDTIREVCGVETELSTSGGTSDGRFIAPTGCEVVEIGPLNASIHKVDEHVRVADLEPLSAIYQGVLERLLANRDPCS